MKVIKKTTEYTIYQTGEGRYAVKDSDQNWGNADEKIKILLAEALSKAVMPSESSAEQAPAEQAPVEEAPVKEAPVEEAPVEEAPVEGAPAEEAQGEGGQVE